MTILDRRLEDSAYAVLDIETTGFRPGIDRVVELCVIRMDPGEAPAITLDTVVDPGRPIEATFVHGITDDDVRGAPAFQDLVGELVWALAGRVLVGHNVSFDRRFVARELEPHGIQLLEVPYIDTMSLRPLLGDGARGSLGATCAAYGITRTAVHRASADAWDTTLLLRVLVRRAIQLGLRNFRELGRRGSYSFLQSFASAPLGSDLASSFPVPPRLLSRTRPFTGNDRIRTYHEALTAVLADLEVSGDEMEALGGLRERLELTIDEVRGLHAQVLAAALLCISSDRVVTDAEVAWLARVSDCLDTLGWCPGRRGQSQ